MSYCSEELSSFAPGMTPFFWRNSASLASRTVTGALVFFCIASRSVTSMRRNFSFGSAPRARPATRMAPSVRIRRVDLMVGDGATRTDHAPATDFLAEIPRLAADTRHEAPGPRDRWRAGQAPAYSV